MDLFQFLLWDFCLRWYHMGLLNINMYPVDAVGLLSKVSWGTCIKTSSGHFCPRWHCVGLLSTNMFPGCYGNVTQSILRNLFQDLLQVYWPKWYRIGLLSVNMFAVDVLGLLCKIILFDMFQYTLYASIHDDIILDLAHPDLSHLFYCTVVQDVLLQNCFNFSCGMSVQNGIWKDYCLLKMSFGWFLSIVQNILSHLF